MADRKPFKGVIGLDIRDSTPDWDAFLPEKAREGAPNVLVVLYDDTGCAAGIPPEQTIVTDAPTSGTHIVGVEFTKERVGEYHEPHGPMKLYVDDEVHGEEEMRTIVSRYSLCGEGLCIGYDGGDSVSSEYSPKFEFTGGRIVKVVFDVADDAYVDVEREMAAAMARD